ncbi:hypothetical protein OY671_008129, partial [Metschnikowia pulcherrima]
ESSRATFTQLDSADSAAQVVGARDARPDRAAVRIRFARGEGGTSVRGDAVRSERVSENSSDNAVSFSPPEGVVDVAVGGEGANVWLSVSDQGPGIPESEREKVFERFHSVRPADEAFGSHSGLGLAIARTIAEAHDGASTITDRPDGAAGACSSSEMPLDRSALLQAVRFALIASAVIATGCDSSTPVAPTAQSTNAPDPSRAPLERSGMQGIARGDSAKAEIQRASRQSATTPCNSQAMGASAPQLKAMGYENVQSLAGGLKAWREANSPIEKA